MEGERCLGTCAFQQVAIHFGREFCGMSLKDSTQLESIKSNEKTKGKRNKQE